jgi:voltage-gated potassium channel
LIDASALLPSAIGAALLLITGEGPALLFFLAVWLLTRSAKLAPYFPGGRRLGRAIRLESGQLLTAVAGLMFVLVIAAGLMFFAESDAHPDTFSSFPASMWWSVVTLTTVGYGDTVPVATAGRMPAAVIAMIGIGLFALPAGILSAGLLEADVDDEARGRNNTLQLAGGVCPHCGRLLDSGGDGD